MLALYIHYPFCVKKCPYCDFNSHVRASWDEEAFCAALLADLEHEAARLTGRCLGSIFFGGGTPSLMAPATAAAVIEAALGHWGAAPDLEVTLEANPNSAEADRFRDFAAAGINRVSLGLQALDDEALRFLGRVHGLEEGLRALGQAQAVFDRVSFDLICARPGQTVEGWTAELTRALGFGTGHLSIYQLTIEPGTRFQTLHARGELVLPDEETGAAIFEATAELTAAAGLPAYEISNHARPGEASRHNLQYWTYGDYAGIGPGAHGRRGGIATERHRKPEIWEEAVKASGHGIRAEAPVPPAEAAREALLMGLRLTAGIDRARFEARTGVALADAVKPEAVRALVREGLLVDDSLGLRATMPGLSVLDGVLRAIAA